MPGSAAISDVGWVDPKYVPRSGSKQTKVRLCIFPRKCHSSKVNIWFKFAYRVRHTYYGYNGEVKHEDRWYHKHEYLRLRLMV